MVGLIVLREVNNMSSTREKLIRNVIYCGQSLIDNAEKIVNDHKYFKDLTITCYVNEKDGCPYINVDSEFIPEGFIEQFK